jgi:hypothetical protein
MTIPDSKYFGIERYKELIGPAGPRGLTGPVGPTGPGGSGSGGGLQNLLINGTFLYDPDSVNVSHECGVGFGGPPPGGWLPGAPDVQPQMPGWVLRDNGTGGNNANSWIITPPGPPDAIIGPNIGEIDVLVLNPGETFDFYQPVHPSYQYSSRPELYSGNDVSFRIVVWATNAGIRAFIRSDAGVVLGTTHTGGGSWQILQVQTTLDSTSIFEVGIRLTSVDTVYVDAATCVPGAIISDLPFIAKPLLDDLLAISSMLCHIQYEFTIWALPFGGGPTQFLWTTSYPVTLRDYPYLDIGGVPMPTPALGPPPPGMPPGMPILSYWNIFRETAAFGLNDPLMSWVGAGLPWSTFVSMTFDARPT